MTAGYTPVPIEHFGGLVTIWPPEMLDSSLAAAATNVRFTRAGIGSREGITPLSKLVGTVAGLAALPLAAGGEQALALDATGQLWQEQQPATGTFARIAAGQLGSAPAGKTMRAAAAYGRTYMAFGSLAGAGAPLSYDGTNLDPLVTLSPTAAPEPQDSPSPGNVAAGQRYVVVLYKLRNGSLSVGTPYPGGWTAAGGKQTLVGAIPTGPANVVARIVAFTVAGGSSDGPYFYIEETQTVNGVSETSTVVADNSTTSATFNFDDAFLSSSLQADDQFRGVAPANECGVFYSPSLDRMFFWGEDLSTLRASAPGDAGLYYGDAGFVSVGPNDGQHLTAMFEWRGGVYVAKERKLYQITPNSGDPATWDLSLISPTVGCCGPDALAVANDFVLLASPLGAYLWQGGLPQLVSDELLGPDAAQPGLWERVNWQQAASIWVHHDGETQTVRVGVPLDGATTPSHVLKLSYLDGWERSLRFSAFTARYHYFPGRRWSLDEIAASCCLTWQRNVSPGGIPADRRDEARQIALAGGTGISIVDAGAATDAGEPFLAHWASGAVSAAERLEQERVGIELLGLVQLRARGEATTAMSLSALTTDGAKEFMRPALGPDVRDHAGLALAAGASVRLELLATGAWEVIALHGYSRAWLPVAPISVASP